MHHFSGRGEPNHGWDCRGPLSRTGSLLYPWSPMAISTAPTFLNIVLALTWLIFALLIYGVYGSGEESMGL